MENEFVEMDSEEQQFDSLSDLGGFFIKSPKVGDMVEMKLKGFKIVKKDLEFTFEDKKTGKQKKATNALSNVDYGIQLIDDRNAVYWVNSWSVWGQLKAIANKLSTKTLAGVEIQIDHAANGMLEENKDKAWIVRTKVEGLWKALGRDSNEWE